MVATALPPVTGSATPPPVSSSRWVGKQSYLRTSFIYMLYADRLSAIPKIDTL